MPFEWREFLVLARSFSSDDREVVLRTAISRAYFAAYGHAFRYAVRFLQFTPRNLSDDHGRLREHLNRSRRRSVGTCLKRLRDWRNKADYAAEFVDDLQATLALVLKDSQYVFDGLPEPSAPT
jgi:hypothetical protein